MANDAHVFFAGYVATDPVYWQNRDGNSKATLRVAYTPRYIDRSSGEWTDSPTSFVTVTCWRKLAENVALCLHKGEPILVSGRLQVRRYDDREGRPQISVDVDAQSVGHDLARGVALFQRTRRVIRDTPAEMTGAGRPASAEAGPEAGGPGELGDAEAAGAAADAHGAAGPGESDDVLDDGAVAALLQGGGSAPLQQGGGSAPPGALRGPAGGHDPAGRHGPAGGPAAGDAADAGGAADGQEIPSPF